MSGPIHAGGFGPNKLDDTFGPTEVFVKAPPRVNASPMESAQYFGMVNIEARGGVMTVALRDISGATLYEKTLAPRRR